MLGTLVSKFFPPPPFISSQLHALCAWAHAECASLHARAFARNLSREIERWPEAAPLLVDEITRRIPRFMEILATALYGGRSPLCHDVSGIRGAQREISFQPCFLAVLHAPMSQFSREIPGEFCNSLLLEQS